MTAQAELQGLWRRDWIKAPGFQDHTTRVHWAQAGDLFADLRIPAGRPDLTGAACLADLDNTALAALMEAEGFAGTITVEHSICTWHRHINWHGRPEAVDAGRMSFGADGNLIEDGVHADYRELWHKLPAGPLTGRVVRAGALRGVLVRSDRMFLIGLGVPDAPPSAPVRAVLLDGRRPDGLAAHFASDYVLGHWQGAQGIADLSTNPLREGQAVLKWDADGMLLWHGTDFYGRETTVRLS